MAVYYATAQYRVLGRLLQPEQIRMWIRGGMRGQNSSGRIIPSLGQMADALQAHLKSKKEAASAGARPVPSLVASIRNASQQNSAVPSKLAQGIDNWAQQGLARKLFLGQRYALERRCDPKDFDPVHLPTSRPSSANSYMHASGQVSQR